MTENQNEHIWGAFGQTIRGAAHERNDLPNQDSIHWFPKQPGKYGPPLVMIVSDGHGSAKSFRSDIGADIATRRTRETIMQLLKSEIITSDLSMIKRLLDERLPRDVVINWAKAIEKHLKENPFTEKELARLEEKEGPAACKNVQDQPKIAYGATLLIVLLSSSFIHILQLGDGDIFSVSDTGEVTRPLLKDERLIANETTSLSQDKAWQEFRSSFIPLAGSPPALILLSSDGYSNSFKDEESFLKVGKDILDLMRTEGPRMVRCSLSDWLKDASQSGSGDDISLGIIYREDAVQPIEYLDLPQQEMDSEECSNEFIEDNSDL